MTRDSLPQDLHGPVARGPVAGHAERASPLPPDEPEDLAERRWALAAALALGGAVLLLSLCLMHGMRRVAVEQNCTMPGQAACPTLADR